MVALMKMPSAFGVEDPSERRMFPRKEIHADIKGKRMDHNLDALKQPLVSLALRDLSLGGLSALSDVPINRGERLTFYFPPQGPSRGWDALGKVIRCESSSLGYRLAIEFDQLPAA